MSQSSDLEESESYDATYDDESDSDTDFDQDISEWPLEDQLGSNIS